MSFLEELKKKRTELKRTETIITTVMGERFLTRSETGNIIKLDQLISGYIIDTNPDVQPACILQDFLYLGSQDAINLNTLNDHQITHVLSIGIEMPLQQQLLPMVINLYVPCLDLPETILGFNILKIAFQFIKTCRDSNGRVLVHCNAGVSRSASVIIAFLIEYENMDFENAYKYVKNKRNCIQPNSGFLKQLKTYRYLTWNELK